MGRLHLLLLLLYLAAVCATPSPVIPNYVSECHTTDELDSNSSFVSVMNQCIAINSPISLPLAIVHQVLDWLQARMYLQYALLVLLTFPVIVAGREETMQLEVLASLARLRFSIADLMIRIASAITLSTYLQLALQQGSPCVCLVEYGSDFYVPVGNYWGLPNTEIIAATLIALFFVQKISIPGAIALFALPLLAQIIGGYASLGQALLAIALGLFLHLYSLYTPVWWRLVDFLLNMIGAFVSFFVVRKNHPFIDLSFSVLLWIGLAWMLFGFAYCYFTFDAEVLGAVLLRPSRLVEDQQFLRYVPLSEEGAQKRLIERLATGAVVAIIFGALIGLRTVASTGFLH